MAVFNSHDQAVFQAGLRAVKSRLGSPHSELPHGSLLTALMRHGGLYTLFDQDMTTARLTPLMTGANSSQMQTTVQQVQSIAESFFYRLCPLSGYAINSDLMSYIAFPHEGAAYEDTPHVNRRIPAIFTFVGQFIDHDLTMNAVNLTVDQSGNVTVDNASPTIDLDNIYGLRTTLNNALGAPGEGGKPYDIFHADGTFKLVKVGSGYDLPRPKEKNSDGLQPAYIIDGRNDENQLVLQIHILLMRVHNKLVGEMSSPGRPREDLIAAVRKEVVANFQSVVLHDYLPRIIQPDTLRFVLGEIAKKDYGALKHKPYRNLVDGRNIVRMPHEFAIGFRFGHSQLRPEYKLNAGATVELFNNRHTGGVDDLRGSRPLSKDHVIDWYEFYPLKPEDEHQSLLIDGRITPPVFDLPETAIPDDIKFIGNLPHRNLIRSRMVGVVCGEELARFYDVPSLSPSDMVDMAAHPEAAQLFSHDGEFKTPLWYYILKEAEVKSNGEMLGPLGSRLVAEVLAGAVYYDDEFRFDPGWKSRITGANKVTMRDLIDFVLGAK